MTVRYVRLFSGSVRTRGLVILTVVSLAFGLESGRAQVVNDGATNTLNNVTNAIAGDVTVGTDGSQTLLILTCNVLLTNSGSGITGHNAAAESIAYRTPDRCDADDDEDDPSSDDDGDGEVTEAATIEPWEADVGPMISQSEVLPSHPTKPERPP